MVHERGVCRLGFVMRVWMNEIGIFMCLISYRDEGGEPLMGLMRITGLILVTVSKISWIVKMIEVWDNHDRLHRSPTPVYNDLKVKPQKRLIKNSSSSGDPDPLGIGLYDDEGDVGEDHGGNYAHVMGMLRDDYTARGKRMSRRSAEKSMNGEKGVKMIKVRKIRVRMRDHEDIIG